MGACIFEFLYPEAIVTTQCFFFELGNFMLLRRILGREHTQKLIGNTVAILTRNGISNRIRPLWSAQK